MTKGQRTMAALLGATGILLAMNLLRGEVTAQPRSNLVDAAAALPKVVGIAVVKGPQFRVFRQWDTGAVDLSWFTFAEADGTNSCNVIDSCGPVVIIDPGP